MFYWVIVKHWSQLEHAIGRNIYTNFLVNATTNASSVTEQALDCITRLINRDFDHKPWNKSEEFNMHIAPKKNLSVSLKDERFNRLPLICAVTLYHFDDVVSFLDKFQHVTNQLACIVRCFLELEFLKVMLCIGALLGVHLVEPFLTLTTSTATTYSKLIPAFQQLYLDLLETEPCKLLNLNKGAFTFVTDSQFTHSRYAIEICRSIEAICEDYEPQV